MYVGGGDAGGGQGGGGADIVEDDPRGEEDSPDEVDVLVGPHDGVHRPPEPRLVSELAVPLEHHPEAGWGLRRGGDGC